MTKQNEFATALLIVFIAILIGMAIGLNRLAQELAPAPPTVTPTTCRGRHLHDC